jgi:hypothetical protein
VEEICSVAEWWDQSISHIWICSELLIIQFIIYSVSEKRCTFFKNFSLGPWCDIYTKE